MIRSRSCRAFRVPDMLGCKSITTQCVSKKLLRRGGVQFGGVWEVAGVAASDGRERQRGDPKIGRRIRSCGEREQESEWGTESAARDPSRVGRRVNRRARRLSGARRRGGNPRRDGSIENTGGYQAAGIGIRVARLTRIVYTPGERAASRMLVRSRRGGRASGLPAVGNAGVFAIRQAHPGWDAAGWRIAAK